MTGIHWKNTSKHTVTKLFRMEDKEYIDWFNKGYALSEHKPELAQAIHDALKSGTSDKAHGFIDGSKQYETEKEKIAEKSKFNKNQNYTLPTSTTGKVPAKEKSNSNDKDTIQVGE